MRQRHKYRAVATVVDGIRFQSKAEAKRYGELKLLEKAKQISGLRLQPRFALMTPSGVCDGEVCVTSIGTYVADFAYEIRLGGVACKTVVEDVKGFKTPLYRWKKKHVEAQYGIEITEVHR